MDTVVTLTAAQLKEAANLKEEIETAQARLTEILSGDVVPRVAKRVVSAATKRAIAEGQARRWAKFRAAKAAEAASTPASTPTSAPVSVAA